MNREKLQDAWLVSMDGLKHHVISHYVEESISELRRNKHFLNRLKYVDNDRAGHIFMKRTDEGNR